MARKPTPSLAQNVVTLPVDTTFKVQIVEPVKPPTVWDVWRPLVIRVLEGTLFIAGLLWFVWVAPMNYPTLTEIGAPELSLTMAYPQYVSRGDEGAIDLTVTNVASHTITGTVLIDFGAAPQVIEAKDSTNLLKLENLPRGGKQTLHVRYQLAQPADFGNAALTFTPRAILENGSTAEYAPQTIGVTFLPLVRTILTGAFGLSALAGLLWGQIKQHLFPS